MTFRDWLIAGAIVSLVALVYTSRPRDEAWVLWEKIMRFTPDGDVTVWEPIDGFSHLVDCHSSGQEIVQGALEFMRTGGRKLLSVRPDGRSAVYEETVAGVRNEVDQRYLCFPPAVDPRTPEPPPVPKT